MPRTRTSGATPIDSAVEAMRPMVSRSNSECWQSMKMKSCPVVLAMRATSPERASRTGMPSATSPACMRALTGLISLSVGGAKTQLPLSSCNSGMYMSFHDAGSRFMVPTLCMKVANVHRLLRRVVHTLSGSEMILGQIRLRAALFVGGLDVDLRGVARHSC